MGMWMQVINFIVERIFETNADVNLALLQIRSMAVGERTPNSKTLQTD